MDNTRIQFLLESLDSINRETIWARFFINPTIALMESYNRIPFPFDISCENVESAQLNERDELEIAIAWSALTFPDSGRLLKTIQRNVVVEYAAVAVAFLLAKHVANCVISEVTLRGDRADYFLNDGHLLLEVSGTENDRHLTNRHKEKVAQLQANPFGKPGFVVVCCFSNQKGRFSYHLAVRNE